MAILMVKQMGVKNVAKSNGKDDALLTLPPPRGKLSQRAEAQRLAREWDEANPREPEPPSPLNR